MPYLSLTDDEKKAMLAEIRVGSFDELLKDIPASLRDPKIVLPPSLTEPEIQALITRMGRKNTTTQDALSFLGAGSYEHFIPAAAMEIVGRQEFMTAYTPYQPEASQGTLQAIYEYQSLMTELTGLDVSNASHYDGATALAEAALVALKQTDRPTLLVARSLHPHYRETIRTYLTGTPYKIEELGFDACLDRHSADFPRQLAFACPKGIDVYFENVGGAVFDAVLPLLNIGARIPLCGLIAHYNDAYLPQSPDRMRFLTNTLLIRRIKMQGFIVFEDFIDRFGDFFERMSVWLTEGRIKYREDVVDGLENAPEAFIGLLEGKNFGKLLVRVAQ